MRPTRSRPTIAALIAVAVAALLASGAASAGASGRSSGGDAMLELINHARISRGLHALRPCDALRRAAVAHSADMIEHGYFAHSSLSGTGVGARARTAGYRTSGCSQWTVGEVIAWGCSSRGSPQAVFKAWMHSRVHRSVILGKRWRDIGVGRVRGTFRGLAGATMYTVDVGRRVR